MAELSGVGAPTKETVGKVGDIYTDTSTDKKYKFVLSYNHKDSYTKTEEVVEESKQNLYNYWKVNLHAISQGSQG